MFAWFWILDQNAVGLPNLFKGPHVPASLPLCWGFSTGFTPPRPPTSSQRSSQLTLPAWAGSTQLSLTLLAGFRVRASTCLFPPWPWPWRGRCLELQNRFLPRVPEKAPYHAIIPFSLQLGYPGRGHPATTPPPPRAAGRDLQLPEVGLGVSQWQVWLPMRLRGGGRQGSSEAAASVLITAAYKQLPRALGQWPEQGPSLGLPVCHPVCPHPPPS